MLTPSPLVMFRLGMSSSLSQSIASDSVWNSLTAAKEAGASIVIDGKKVALGIPGGGKQPDDGKPVPGIPLGRGATPDEAANGIIL